jgi:exopolysaccharide biosynthesis protein
MAHHALVLTTHAQTPTASSSPEIAWQPLSDGLEQTHFQLPSSTLLSSSVVAVRASLDRFSMRVIRATEYGSKKASVKEMCRSSGASVCINSNFFDEQGKPLGVVISRGIQHQKVHQGGGTLTGVLFATADKIGVAHRSSFNAEKVIEATQAGPRLISEGAPVVGVKDSSNPTNLSIACVDRESRLVLLRVSLAMFGSSLKELQRVLLRPEMGCWEALNFDGGGSSQMYISGQIPGHQGATREEDFPGRDDVPVAIGLFRR